jgi:hypothetical protein
LFNLALTLGLSSLGCLLSLIIREPNVLLPVSIVAMPIDFVGAMTPVGFTNSMVKAHPNAVNKVMVHVPHLSGLSLENMIGPGDILFIAFFFTCINRMSMNLKGTLILMLILLSLTQFEVTVFGFPVGALIPMGIAVIVVFAVVGTFYYYAHKAILK